MTLKSLVFSILLGAVAVQAAAQMPAPSPKRPYRVLSYKLLMDWRPIFNQKTQLFHGRNQITVTLIDTTSAIVLDAAEMNIDSVSINGQLIATPTIMGDTVSIPLTLPERAKGTQLTLLVSYTRTAAFDDGIYFYPKGSLATYYGITDTTTEDVAYTMSEPLDAHKWMPCNDEPYNKANSEISVTVPSGISAQSNGTLQSVDTNTEDGSHTYRWKSDRPIATYLMAAYASTWVTGRSYYHRITNPQDSVPVIYYVWPSDNAPDTSGRRFSARFAFRNTPKMLENDSKLFGEYPFVDYSQVPLEPFGFGGMEHQTITALYRPVLTGKEEYVIAHELFHQWFGDKTTCETWADIWLNEGFATYGEMLWAEVRGGHPNYLRYAEGIANDYLQRNFLAPIYDPPVAHMFDSYVPTVYWKPGCVLHMLRAMLNDDTLFFNTLRDYSNAFAYSTANTFQFRDFIANRIGSRSPIDIKTFIDEWIFRPDYPIYDMGWALVGNEVRLRVNQIQDSTDHYIMPLHFWGIRGQDTIQFTVIDSLRNQTFRVNVPHGFDTLVFDQDGVIISEFNLQDDPTLVVNGNVPLEEPLRVMQAHGSVKLSYDAIVSEGALLKIVDVLGRTVVERPLVIGSTVSSVSYSTLSSGDFFATLTDGSRTQTTKFHVEK